jgi:hypothetical protein
MVAIIFTTIRITSVLRCHCNKSRLLSRSTELALALSPQRGEMFIAWRFFFAPELRRSAITLDC